MSVPEHTIVTNVGTDDDDDNNQQNNDDSEQNDDDNQPTDDTNVTDLKTWMGDDNSLSPRDRTQYMLNLCFAYLPEFRTDVLPFNHKTFSNIKKMHKESRRFLQREMKRRSPQIRGLKNYKIGAAKQFLLNLKLPEEDMLFLKSELQKYKDSCQKAIDEYNKDNETASTNVARITVDEFLLFPNWRGPEQLI